MPPDRRIGSQRTHAARPRGHGFPRGRGFDLPPPFRLVALREAGDALGHARTHAEELGAGTLICVGRFDLAEFAVVLQPDEAFGPAWRTLYAGMLALADALASVAPPKTPIAIEWPDAIRIGGELIGGGRLAWPDGTDAAAPPSCLVFGAMIRTVAMTPDGAGVRPLAPVLDDEASGEDGADLLIESFARHLMGIVDRWQETGFASIAEAYVARLASSPGMRHDIGDNGDLLVTRIGAAAARHRLQPMLAAPSWLDPAAGGGPHE
jgi:biotin-(acetyl-CoA carboxylase) ligase